LIFQLLFYIYIFTIEHTIPHFSAIWGYWWGLPPNAIVKFKISEVKKPGKPYKLAGGGGLFLLVKPNGSKLWQLKYRHLGKDRLLSHRKYPDLTLAQPRQKLHDARALLAEGK